MGDPEINALTRHNYFSILLLLDVDSTCLRSAKWTKATNDAVLIILLLKTLDLIHPELHFPVNCVRDLMMPLDHEKAICDQLAALLHLGATLSFF